MISNVSSTPANASTGTGTTSATSAQGMQDQFLTLLVAQLQNQDPTQPMDNAQMTSQMAQISTVSGIEKLNDTVSSVTSQFASLQILQGTGMIGHTVLSEGNTLATSAEGQSTAAFDLGGSAANVSVSITTSTGQLVDTVEMGSLDAGRHYFNWDSSQFSGDPSTLRFNVQARNADTAVAATPLAASAVVATSLANGQLMLELSNGGKLEYNQVKAVF